MSSIQKYYLSQARTGLSGFSGPKHLKGGSIFSLLARIGGPALKFLGKTLGAAGINIAQDFLDGDMSKDSLKRSAKRHAKQGAKNMVNYTASRMGGMGVRRRARRRSRKAKPIKRAAVKRRGTVRRRRRVSAHRYLNR